jgi:hypothetical protein
MAVMTTLTTNEEIIRMAREAGLEWQGGFTRVIECVTESELQRFAALVEQRVRSEIALEELAKISQELGGY